MTDDLVIRGPGDLTALLDGPQAPQLSPEDREVLGQLWRAAQADATIRAYRADWKDWELWCRLTGNRPLPAHPVAVALYLADVAQRGRKIGTIRRRVAAIGWVHTSMRQQSPSDAMEVTAAVSGLARQLGSKVDKKKAIDLDLLRRMVAQLDQSDRGKRDRALLLLGFFGAFRRSEYVALTTANIERRADGIIIHLDKSKTDQEGAGQAVPVAPRPEEPALCPIQALEAWLEERKGWADFEDDDWIFFGFTADGKRRTSGHLNDKEVNRLVKRLVAGAGLDAKDFGAHSLRAGFVTQALRDGASLAETADVSRHKDLNVMMGYRREENLIASSAATRIGRPGAQPGAQVPTQRTLPLVDPSSHITLERVFFSDALEAVRGLEQYILSGGLRLTTIALAEKGTLQAAAGAWLAAAGFGVGNCPLTYTAISVGDLLTLVRLHRKAVLLVPAPAAVGLPRRIGFLFSPTA